MIELSGVRSSWLTMRRNERFWSSRFAVRRVAIKMACLSAKLCSAAWAMAREPHFLKD